MAVQSSFEDSQLTSRRGNDKSGLLTASRILLMGGPRITVGGHVIVGFVKEF